MRKLKLYLETSVWSFYYADDAPEKKEITRRFFTFLPESGFDIIRSEICIGDDCAGRCAAEPGKPARFGNGVQMVSFSLKVYGLLQALTGRVPLIVLRKVIAGDWFVATKKCGFFAFQEPRIAYGFKVPEMVMWINEGHTGSGLKLLFWSDHFTTICYSKASFQES